MSSFAFSKKSTAFAYADDIAIVVKHKCLDTATAIMQEEFDNVSKWCHDQGLVINATKTKIMHIRTPFKPEATINIYHRNDHCPASAKNEAIELVKTIKYLGTTIDENFLWRSHINNLRLQLKSAVFAMVYLKRYTNVEVQKLVYYSLVESRIRYGILAWGNAAKTHLDKIANIQHRLVKIVNTNNVNFKVLDVYAVYKMTTLLEYFDDTRFQQPICHNRNTRRRAQGLLEIPEFFNIYGKRELRYVIPNIMNSIPANLKHIVNYKKRKKVLKRYFLNINHVI